jgi:hypothetical protein
MPLLLPGRLKKYRPIKAGSVARAMVHIAREARRGTTVYEYDAMLAAIERGREPEP